MLTKMFRQIMADLIRKIFLKKAIVFAVLISVVFLSYFAYQEIQKNNHSPQYITSKVRKGTIVVSLSGTGQVSALDQVDIKAKNDGDVASAPVLSGSAVSADDIIAKIDNQDARNQVRDAETSLETAKLELDELLMPADEIDILRAENSVSEAERYLNELINPKEEDLTQAESALISAKDALVKLEFSQEDDYRNSLDAKQKAEEGLDASYEDAFNVVSSAFLDLPTLVTELRNILYSYEIAESEIIIGNSYYNVSALKNSVNYESRTELEKIIESAVEDFETAEGLYEESFENYKDISRYSEKDIIESLLNETLETARAISETAKSEMSMLDYWVDFRSSQDLRVFDKVSEYQSDIKSYTSKINSHLVNLLSEKRSLQDGKEEIFDAQRNLEKLDQNQPIDLAAAKRTVEEKQDILEKLKNPEQYDIEAAQISVEEKKLALEELKAGADNLEIRAKQIVVQQKQDALASARENLADCEIRAPFEGIVAELNVKKGDAVSAGASIASLITKQKIAEISFNEIDVSQIQEGQRAILRFDALEDFSVSGQVAEIDTLGTVSQGVVSYGVKIIFDAQDQSIKPGMSVSADIIIESKKDVLIVPLMAVKTDRTGANYVEIMSDDSDIQRTQISIGISNDTMAEITDGLQEGQSVVTQTMDSSSGSAGSDQTQNFGNRDAGSRDAMRMMGGMMR